MPRARNIKPAFFMNEEVAELPFEYRLLFIGLWTLADREGRLENRPKRIRMSIFPCDDVDCAAGIVALKDRGLVVMYEADGNAYIWIPSFLTHQKPHPRELASIIPPYLGKTKAAPRSCLGTTKAKASPADVLNPDVLNPELTTLLGKPNDAVLILEFLNDKAGRRYKPNAVNLDFIKARLKEGFTPAECRQVVAKKCREWAGDEKMANYLRPATLFNRTKFSQYAGELVVPGVPNAND